MNTKEIGMKIIVFGTVAVLIIILYTLLTYGQSKPF